MSQIQLPPVFKIGAVDEVRAAMDQCIDALGDGSAGSPARVEIGAGEVEQIDFCGLQLLLAFATALRERDVAIGWSAVDDCLVEAAERAGTSQLLGLGAD